MSAPEASAERPTNKRRHQKKHDESKRAESLAAVMTTLQQLSRVHTPTSRTAPSGPTADRVVSLQARRFASIAVLAVLAVLLLVFVSLSRPTHERVCVTNACTIYSQMLGRSISADVDPCDDFHGYVCDGWTRHNRHSVMEDMYHRFMKSVTRMAEVRAVPMKGQASVDKAAGFYQSCRKSTGDGREHADSLRRSLQGCGLYWPILDASSDLMNVVSCTSVDLYWRTVFAVESTDKIHFVIEPSPYYGDGLERREEMLVAQKYELYFRALSDYFRGTSNGTTLTYQGLLELEKTVVWPLRDAFHSDDGGTLKDIDLATVAAFTASHIPVSRWQSVITKNYNITKIAALLFTIQNLRFFHTFFDLTEQVGEHMMAYYVGWTTVQRMARQLNVDSLNEIYYLTARRAGQMRKQFCNRILHYYMGLAFYADYVNRVATPAVMADLSNLTRNIKESFHEALALSWIEVNDTIDAHDSDIDPSLTLLQMAKPEILDGICANIPDMSGTFYVNIRRAPFYRKLTAPLSISKLQAGGEVRLYQATPEHFVLYPNALEMPLYDIDLPTRIKYAALGSEIATAVSTMIFGSWSLWNASATAKLLSRAACFLGENLTAEEFKSSHSDLLIRVAALRVLWKTVNGTGSGDEVVALRGLEHLSGQQLFFAVLCFMHCGKKNGPDLCNRPLRQLDAFAEAFSCAADSAMGSSNQCQLL